MEGTYKQKPQPRVTNAAAARSKRKSTPRQPLSASEDDDDDDRQSGSSSGNEAFDDNGAGGDSGDESDQPQSWQPRRDDPFASPDTTARLSRRSIVPPIPVSAKRDRSSREEVKEQDEEQDEDQDDEPLRAPSPMDEDFAAPGGGDDYAPMDDDFPALGDDVDDYAAPADPPPSSRRTTKTSRTQPDSPQQDLSPSGKKRTRDDRSREEDTKLTMADGQDSESDVGGDGDQGLGQDDEPHMMGDDDEEEQTRPKKKPRAPRSKKSPSWMMPVDDDDAEARGLRRGSRLRYAPLDFWRLEKVVYGRPSTGHTVVPVIKEIIRHEEEPIKPLGGTKKKGNTGKKEKGKKKKSRASEDREPTPDDERGMDLETDPMGDVRDYITGDIVRKRLAFTSAMVTPKQAERDDFQFQKMFGDSDFFAAGQLLIPVGKKKPVKPSRDNSYVFFLHEGKVKFQVHHSEFLLTTGSQFFAPRGNHYLIKNVGKRDARIFFAQARKVAPEPDVAPEIATPRRPSAAPGNGVPPSSDRRSVTSRA